MTLDEFINKYEDGLRNLVLSGFFFDDRTPAARYRMASANARMVNTKLIEMYNDLFPPPKPVEIPKQAVHGGLPSQAKPSNGTSSVKQEIKR